MHLQWKYGYNNTSIIFKSTKMRINSHYISMAFFFFLFSSLQRSHWSRMLVISCSDLEPPLPSQTKGLIMSVYLSVKMFDL